MDTSKTSFRKSREMFWMFQPIPVLSYGLDNPNEKGIHVLTGKMFPHLSINYPRFNKRKLSSKSQFHETRTFFENIL